MEQGSRGTTIQRRIVESLTGLRPDVFSAGRTITIEIVEDTVCVFYDPGVLCLPESKGADAVLQHPGQILDLNDRFNEG